MEIYTIKNLTFTYPGSEKNAVDDVTLSVGRGDFIALCGKSGCGKSTFLRQLKPVIAPHGKRSGSVLFAGRDISDIELSEQSAKIGFVTQNPDNSIVTDKVWHELAFGLESLGMPSSQIRARVAETASFFGIQTWFHKKTSELSGGQKQLLSLASVMVMRPEVLILDEPTSQLDPVSAQSFLETVSKINRELGITVILTEQRLEEVFAVCGRVLVMDGGKIISDGTPREVCLALTRAEHDMRAALPAPARIFAGVKNGFDCPVTVREGREWLEKTASQTKIEEKKHKRFSHCDYTAPPVIELRDVWFRYEKDLPDVIKGLSAKIYPGELYAVTGGNGTGKTTALSVISGLLRPYRGEVRVNGERLDKIRGKYNGLIGVLPQNPQTLFVKKTVLEDLYEILPQSGRSDCEAEERVKEAVEICGLEELVTRHPYDLSGGERQRAALAKILLLNPRIILLDEPTKGMDAHFKISFAGILRSLTERGVTVVMVSHDAEFCARYADRCAMFFDGNIVSEDCPDKFFSGKYFYTTSANRMAGGLLPNAVIDEDVILSCGGEVPREERRAPRADILLGVPLQKKDEKKENGKKARLTPARIIFGAVFGVLFVLTTIFADGKFTGAQSAAAQGITLLEITLCLACFIPRAGRNSRSGTVTREAPRGSLKGTLIAAITALLAIPATIFIGKYYFGDRKYYFISLMIIMEAFIPFFVSFERRKPRARELVVIGVMCAAAAVGRAAFYMLPQFKPALAVVIVTGACLGSQTGFLVGAVSAFISNFFFGQGPWTPWQMFAFGLIGFTAGILFGKGFLRRTKTALAIFGMLAAVLIYGGIMNTASVLMWQNELNKAMLASAYITGFPFDLIHGASTAFFLWVISEPMTEKLDRIKAKYGICI